MEEDGISLASPMSAVPLPPLPEGQKEGVHAEQQQQQEEEKQHQEEHQEECQEEQQQPPPPSGSEELLTPTEPPQDSTTGKQGFFPAKLTDYYFAKYSDRIIWICNMRYWLMKVFSRLYTPIRKNTSLLGCCHLFYLNCSAVIILHLWYKTNVKVLMQYTKYWIAKVWYKLYDVYSFKIKTSTWSFKVNAEHWVYF